MIVPSIDLLDGRAVQLRHGKEKILTSEEDPISLVKEYNKFGQVAVIDLDSALNTGKNNKELIKEMCRLSNVRVGGGIRNLEMAKEFLRAGAQYLIIGTAATPDLLRQLPSEKIIVALDHKSEIVVDHGWTQTTKETIFSRASRLAKYCSSFLCTFVEREGDMSGFPVEDAVILKEKLSKPVTVAGGIANTEEVVNLLCKGVDVQVGMALYTGKIDLIEAVVRSTNFEKSKLIPTIVQDFNGQILMLAYSSPESLRLALKESKGIYFSRSRNELWRKGETSGNIQDLIKCRTDCDRDALIFTVQQQGVACHMGQYSCFEPEKFSVNSLFKILKNRLSEMPEDSYTSLLFRDRKELYKKIMEEADEVVRAKSFSEIKWEIADVIYFLSVLAVQNGLNWSDIENELSGRNKPDCK